MRPISHGRRILCDMRCPDFLQLLLDSRRMGPTEAARAIELPTAQGTISKFLRGGGQDPRALWTKKLPKALGFDPAALRDEDVAEREAARLGLRAGSAPLPLAIVPAREPKQQRIDPGMLALQIADLMRAYNPAERETAAALFAGAAKDPESSTRIAAALRAQIRKLLSGIDDKLASIRASAYVITVCAILATLALLAR